MFEKTKKLAQHIRSKKSFILTTHKMGDGDGIGSMMGLYHALSQIQKKVRIITVDEVANKYKFLTLKNKIESWTHLKSPIQPTDMALILDTNDLRRVQPLYNALKQKCQQIIYIDHHPVLKTLSKPKSPSIVSTSSASTGEIVYFLIKALKIKMTKDIAEALYVSIVFDTQRFQFIRQSALSHKICEELIPYIKNNEWIYNHLFGITSLGKWNMLAQVIHQTEYYHQKKVAVLEINNLDLNKNKLTIEDACDFLDMTLQIHSIHLSILILRLSKNEYKMSFRSKKANVSQLAEMFKGGGHKHAAGANLKNYTKNPKVEVLNILKNQIKKL